MLKIDLNGQWRMRDVKQSQWLEARVPGTVYADLMRAGKAPDPFYRDNEDKIAPLFQEDYEYEREFTATAEALAYDRVLLCFEGLDTLAEISVNGRHAAKTNNMHRAYEFDVKGLLNIGANMVRVLLKSSPNWLDQFPGNPGVFAKRSIQLIRQAQCAYGWDWGMSLPDAGIWKPACLKCFNAARIDGVLALQRHRPGGVTLEFRPEVQSWGGVDLTLEIAVAIPGGSAQRLVIGLNPGAPVPSGSIDIENPQLWWPRGYGSQALYQVVCTLKDGECVLDAKEMRIGLRTVSLRREKDQWGRSYEFVINGRALYMQGANLIIEDSVLGHVTPERTERMLRDCVKANYNCIRIWGGANYPQDGFYDLCDELGIVLYHDFMFACTFYPADDAFLDNVRREASDNVKRLRHHASIGMWSGNNEVEMMFALMTSADPAIVKMREQFGIPDLSAYVEQFKADYAKLFYGVIPAVVKDLDPQASYVSSSPSIHPDDLNSTLPGAVGEGSMFAMQSGDAHYYTSYDNLSPYTLQRRLHFRFVSEMGFQSYPDYKTIQAFTEPADRRPDSPVMYKHQKCNNGNQIIEMYMNEDYKKPLDFRRYVYASQILAGEVLKYAVEHFRRERGRNMGVLLWQLNDCWPVVSWAGVDYFGRWKAQQYYAKRFFSPVLVSALDDGLMVGLHVTNDTLADVSGALTWSLREPGSAVIQSGRREIIVLALSAGKFADLDFSGDIASEDIGRYYLEYALEAGGETLSHGTVLFVKPKDFAFLDPHIKLDVFEKAGVFEIRMESKAYAKSVMLNLENADCIFSDNCFDLSAGVVKTVTVEKDDLSEMLGLEEFRKQLKAMSVFDIG